MEKINLSIRTWFFIAIIFIVANFLRFYQLGIPVLDSPEAAVAMEALRVVENHPQQIQTDLLLVHATAALFYLFGDNNALLRLLPALIGSLFVLTPLLFQRWLGIRPAILLSAVLAIEPTFIALSRYADGRMLTIALVVFALGFLLHRQYWLGAISLALFLLSGRSVGYGLVLLALVAAWTWLGDKKFMQTKFKEWVEQFAAMDRRTFGIVFVFTFALAGTLFLLNPQGLSAAVTGWIDFFQHWAVRLSGNLMLQTGGILLTFGLFPLLVGIWGIIRLEKRGGGKFWSIVLRWLIAAFVLFLLYPSKHPLDWAWVVLPLWCFAAVNITILFEDWRQIDMTTFGAAVFLFVLQVFFLLNWITAVNVEYDSQQLVWRAILLGGTFLLMTLTLLMVLFGWGIKPGINALTISLGTLLILFNVLGGALKATGVNGMTQMEVWRNSAYPSQIYLLKQTVRDLGEWNHGDADLLEVTIVGIDDPVLQWELRQYNLQSVNVLSPGDSPEVVVSSSTGGDQWSESYRGQSFVIGEAPIWEGMTLREWQQWMFYRKAPTQQTEVILWSRADLFPGSEPAPVE